MDTWQPLQNWIIFGAGAVAIGGYYYHTHQQRVNNRQRPAAGRRASAQGVQEGLAPAKNTKRRTPAADTSGRAGGSDLPKPKSEAIKEAKEPAPDSGKKRKAGKKVQVQAPTSAPAASQEPEEEEEVDESTKAFAARMAAARQGAQLGVPQRKEKSGNRFVKQSSAASTPNFSSASSQGGADADDDMSPDRSPAMNAGGVADMLEPSAPGPSTLRLTDPSRPMKEKTVRQPKAPAQEETKKQRQNRMKKEREQAERAELEKQRRVDEEAQRRRAREARGEPARNGIPAKAPTSSAWDAQAASRAAAAPAVNGITNGNTNTPLLDTFDAESTASSNGVMNGSTAATSATGSAAPDHDMPSEEEQMQMAMKQSEDESGWNMVQKPKKQKKANGVLTETDGNGTSGAATPIEEPAKKSAAAPKLTNGRPKGFQALKDGYEELGDPDSADSWAA